MKPAETTIAWERLYKHPLLGSGPVEVVWPLSFLHATEKHVTQPHQIRHPLLGSGRMIEDYIVWLQRHTTAMEQMMEPK
jgi:hypothetical protein